ncbi:MAG: hypothetical protein LLG04_16175 [Parachlamydia sp.]|nr:hypothetical protein [Parachlamydia sp.]
MSKNEPDSDGHTVHQPEYVILDAEEETPQSDQSGELFDTLKALSAKHIPWPMRIAFLFLFFFCLAFAVILIIHLLFHTVLATVTLFQSPALNSHVQKAWKILVSAIVVALGFAIAIFSPTFGLSVMMLYFMLHRDNQSGAFVTSFFKTRFKS